MSATVARNGVSATIPSSAQSIGVARFDVELESRPPTSAATASGGDRE